MYIHASTLLDTHMLTHLDDDMFICLNAYLLMWLDVHIFECLYALKL